MKAVISLRCKTKKSPLHRFDLLWTPNLLKRIVSDLNVYPEVVSSQQVLVKYIRVGCLCLFLSFNMSWAQVEVQVDTAAAEKGLPQAIVRAPLTATESTVGAVRWLSKRRQFTLGDVPYGVTGLPFAYLSSNTGWNVGMRVHWADYRRRPYRYKLTLHVQRSTEGKLKNRIRLKVPRISGTGFGVRLELFGPRALDVVGVAVEGFPCVRFVVVVYAYAVLQLFRCY